MIPAYMKGALIGVVMVVGLNNGLCLAQEGAAGEPPIKQFPDVSGVVIDGAMDTSTPKLEAVARFLMEQQEAAKAGDMARYQEIGRQAESNLLNVVAPSRPIPHAAVSLFSHESGSSRGGPWTATADAEGKFEFFDVPEGLYRVVAQDTRAGTNGCPSAELTMEHDRTCEQVRLVVYPMTLTVRGRVTDSRGHPLTNATVSARQGHERYVPSEGDFTRAYHETTALTDGEGRYELTGLVPAGLWKAGGLEGGGYGGADSWYTIRIAAQGYVPVKAYVPVVPELTRQAARIFGGLLKSLASDYEIAKNRKETPLQQPHCEGSTLSGVDFVLCKPASLTGSVVNKRGLPQPGCSVHLEATNRLDNVSCVPSAVIPNYVEADTNGVFRFDGVPPDTYAFKVYEAGRCVNGGSPVIATVQEGVPKNGVRLEHDALPFGRIEGVVSDRASGKPVKGLSLYVAKVTGSAESAPSGGQLKSPCLCGYLGSHTAECDRWQDRLIQTNDMRVSAFIFENVSPGQVELVVKAPGYAEERVSVDVAPDGLSKPEIKLWRSGTARIRPVIKAGARVDCYASVPGTPPLVEYVAVPAQGGKGVRGGRPSKQTGYDEFADLKPGNYTLRGAVRYLSDGVTRCETVPVEINSEQTSEVPLDFNGSCGLKLELAFSPGTAIWAQLELPDTPSTQDQERSLGLRAAAYFRGPGAYLFPDLKPGIYRLSLFCRKVPSVKGQKESTVPDQVKVLTLEEGHSTQTLNYQF